MPETTIPDSTEVLRALGAWLAPGSGPDEQDALVGAILRCHAHPDYHPADGGSMRHAVGVLVDAAVDDEVLFYAVHGLDAYPCAGEVHDNAGILDTPPAAPGDTLCRACRGRVTAAVFGAATDGERTPGGADPGLAAAIAAGARLLEQQDALAGITVGAPR